MAVSKEKKTKIEKRLGGVWPFGHMAKKDMKQKHRKIPILLRFWGPEACQGKKIQKNTSKIAMLHSAGARN